MKNAKNTFLVEKYVDGLVAITIARVHEDFDSLVDSISLKLQERHKLIKVMIEKAAPPKKVFW